MAGTRFVPSTIARLSSGSYQAINRVTAFHMMLPNNRSECQQKTLMSKYGIDRKEAEGKISKTMLGQCRRGIKAAVAAGHVIFWGAKGQTEEAWLPRSSWNSCPDHWHLAQSTAVPHSAASRAVYCFSLRQMYSLLVLETGPHIIMEKRVKLVLDPTAKGTHGAIITHVHPTYNTILLLVKKVNILFGVALIKT